MVCMQYPGIPGLPPRGDAGPDSFIPSTGAEESKSSAKWIFILIILAAIAMAALYLSGVLGPKSIFQTSV